MIGITLILSIVAFTIGKYFCTESNTEPSVTPDPVRPVPQAPSMVARQPATINPLMSRNLRRPLPSLSLEKERPRSAFHSFHLYVFLFNFKHFTDHSTLPVFLLLTVALHLHLQVT